MLAPTFSFLPRLLRAPSSALFVLLLSCAAAPERSATTAPPAPAGATSAAATPAEPELDYYQPTWGDSSGKEGKGGTKLTVSKDGRLPLIAAGFDKSKRGDAVTEKRPEWLLFHGPGKESLAFEWTWVTQGDDKFLGQTWGGGGVAFNGSWMAVDATAARYLVLWVKASRPGVEMTVRLHSALKTKGAEQTTEIGLSRFVSGGKIDETWRRAVVPIAALPDIERVELKGLQQVMFNVKVSPPENEKVRVFLDDLYLTNLDMVTPVTNLGSLLVADGLRLEWEKDAGEKVKELVISVNGRRVGTVPPAGRSFLVPKKELGTVPVTVAVTTVGATESSEPVSVQVNPLPPAAATATVTLGKPAHDISPHIFGVNWGSAKALTDLGATGNRWGGNRTTKYNWKDDIDSAGSDWFFLNDYGAEPGTPETAKSYYRFIKETLSAKAAVNFTIPITPWIAKKHPTKGQRYCSYPTSLYPKQERTDGQGCGNGRTPDKKPIFGNDPNLGMTKNTPELQKEFVQNVVKLFGRADKGGVAFYSLDNEPGLWMHTHRDSMPKGISAGDLVRMNVEYAAAVKAADPSAKVIGFASWGPKELAGSNFDYFEPGVPNGHEREEKWSFQEQPKRGGDSQLVYYLKELKKAEAKAGKRLVDVVDIHWYPEVYAKNSLGRTERTLNDVAYDPAFTPVQFEALREWWDPTFVPEKPLESWTYDPDPQKDRLWRPYHPVIASLRKILDTHYPGTKLAINEYDTGSPEHYHGALLRAAALGYFMQEDLYMAQNWHQTGSSHHIYFAQKLYGNYDGQGSRVGGKFVPAKSSHADLYAFGAKRRGTSTVVLVNRNKTTPIDAVVALPGAASKVRTFTLAESLGLRLLEQQAKADGKTVKVTVPAFAAMLVEVK